MSDALVQAVVGGAIALAGGAVGLLGKHVFDRRMKSRDARRAFYVELVTLLMGRREYMNLAPWTARAELADLPQEQIDRVNALLKIDATPSVRTKAERCLALLQQFHVSRSMNPPIEFDENGPYETQSAFLAASQAADSHNRAVRIRLGRIVDEYGAAVDELAEEVSRAVHRGL